MRRFLLIFLFLAPLVSRAADTGYLRSLRERAQSQALADDPRWRVLLHMKKKWGGRWESQVDGRSFFLSPIGKTDAGAELDATLTAFFEPPPASTETLHPQSLFPARYAYLKETLGFDGRRLPEIQSPRLEKWRNNLDVDGVSLVFATAYLNNPASMFGHTFLRLHQRGTSRADPLLDYTANFAAVTAETSGVAFAVKGLLGGYPGKFSTHPYYMKIQQYNNMENRDLWEYDLALSSSQVRRLLDHLWEMGPTYFRYFFLTENCSYQLLPLLEVADPTRALSDGFSWKAIPVDTLRRVLAEPDFVVARRGRPAQLKFIQARRALLTPAERRWVKRTSRSGPLPSDAGFPPERRALLWEAAYDYNRLHHKFRRYGPPAQEARERQLLLERSRAPGPGPDVSAAALATLEPPEIGHPTGRVGLGCGRGGGQGFEEIELRTSLHDLTDPSPGFPRGSRLSMFTVKGRFLNETHRASLERGTLVDIVSISPWDSWSRLPSWRFFMGWDRARDRLKRPAGGSHFTLNGGSGLSVETSGRWPAIFYARADADLGVGGVFRENARVGLGGTGGILWASSPRLKISAEGGAIHYAWGQVDTVTRWTVVAGWSLFDRWLLRTEFSRAGVYREGLATLNFFL
ncbi:MAG: DUF4105 domain-containing protein [Elusimicrobia bacterium]|nr:DUF4105 domain-containing protein [Elusimicrobiota bacterium]MBK7544292.1 DUF4105 domain-containing protein [Elusimicrobiota bacterium]MBK7573814.1 DUF4105 domain-containing protein [Elusimicrobiota bacterium]MBK7689412.1 DUF4105 domain-containing protein [Elusimicrobiota bacterium]MBK8125958.1 DUF4105 domain-containing protein [Elusimicrobiota bacterium]